MYWYWTGEAALGKLKGVKKTRIGSLNHKEVVEVFYNPKETNVKEMRDTLKGHDSFYSYIYRNENELADAKDKISSSEIKKGSGNISYIKSKHSLKVKYPKIFKSKMTEEEALRLNTWAHFGGKKPEIKQSKKP